jgi:manganese/iron transport system substrate-binding protein
MVNLICDFKLWLLFLINLETGICKDSGSRPVLVSSTTQIADFAAQIVGDRCDCKMYSGSRCRSAYIHADAPGCPDGHGADLTLQNGLYLEGKNWMAVLAKDAGKPLVTCTEGIRL